MLTTGGLWGLNLGSHTWLSCPYFCSELASPQVDSCQLFACNSKINVTASEGERKAERNWRYLEQIRIS